MERASDRDAREIEQVSLFTCRLPKTTLYVLWVLSKVLHLLKIKSYSKILDLSLCTLSTTYLESTSKDTMLYQ